MSLMWRSASSITLKDFVRRPMLIGDCGCLGWSSLTTCLMWTATRGFAMPRSAIHATARRPAEREPRVDALGAGEELVQVAGGALPLSGSQSLTPSPDDSFARSLCGYPLAPPSFAEEGL